MFFILPRTLPRSRRVAGDGGAEAAPTQAALGRLGCFGRPDGTPRELRRRKGWWAAVCVPITAHKFHQSNWHLHLNEKKNRVSRSEDSSGAASTPRPGGRRLAQILVSQFTLAVAG